MRETNTYVTVDSDTEHFDVIFLDGVSFSDGLFSLLLSLLRRISVNYKQGYLGDVCSGFSIQLSSCYAECLRRNTVFPENTDITGSLIARKSYTMCSMPVSVDLRLRKESVFLIGVT